MTWKAIITDEWTVPCDGCGDPTERPETCQHGRSLCESCVSGFRPCRDCVREAA